MAKQWDLRNRTMAFAVATFEFCRTLPRTSAARDVARQLRRSATSVAANCRAMRRSQSDGAFASKAAIVIEEADESGFWLEFLVNVRLAGAQSVQALETGSKRARRDFHRIEKNRPRENRSKKRIPGNDSDFSFGSAFCVLRSAF